MNRPHTIIACRALIDLVPLLWLGFLFLRPAVRVDEKVYDAITVGMTRAEVERIVGGPQGEYSGHSRERYGQYSSSYGLGISVRVEYSIWTANECTLVVAFATSEGDRVIDKLLVESTDGDRRARLGTARK